MLDVFYNGENLLIENSDKKGISFNINTNRILLDEFDVTFPGEYEKSNILLEVKEYSGILFYHFLIDSKHIVIVTEDNFDLKEEMSDFFGDVDILIIVGTKQSCKLFESIESKIVIPYGEGKDLFLNTLGQHIDEVDKYKQKGELPIDNTEFVNLNN